MKKRYSILGFEHKSWRELCQCDTNPEQIVKAAEQQTTTIGRIKTRKYLKVRFVDNYKASEAQIEMPWS